MTMRTGTGTRKLKQPHYLQGYLYRQEAHQEAADAYDQMAQIEERLESAQRRREEMRSESRTKTLDAHVDNRIQQARSRLSTLKEKQEYQVLVSVVLKHHTKEKEMRKKARDDKERRDYEAGQKQQVNQHFQAKLKQAQDQLDKRSKSLNLKMKRMELKQAEQREALEDYKNER